MPNSGFVFHLEHGIANRDRWFLKGQRPVEIVGADDNNQHTYQDEQGSGVKLLAQDGRKWGSKKTSKHQSNNNHPGVVFHQKRKDSGSRESQKELRKID